MRVRFQLDKAFIARTSYLGIDIGNGYLKYPKYVREAIISHEKGHYTYRHNIVVILACLFIPFCLKWVSHYCEFWADDYAVRKGHAQGLLKLLESEWEGDFWYPSHESRRNRIINRLASVRGFSNGSA